MKWKRFTGQVWLDFIKYPALLYTKEGKVKVFLDKDEVRMHLILCKIGVISPENYTHYAEFTLPTD